MRSSSVGLVCLALLGVAGQGGVALAQSAPTPSPSTPTPATPGPNPGAAATEAVTSPARPPAEVAPGGPAAPKAPLPDTTLPETPTRPDGRQGLVRPDRTPAMAIAAQDEVAPRAGMSNGEVRDLLDAARATAKATREAVDYGRVVPDILTQVLAKLDKIEDKLDKVEMAVKGQAAPRRR